MSASANVSKTIPRSAVFAVLAAGVLAVSFSAIFVRWCEAPALVIAFYRLFFASLFLILLTGRQTLAEVRSLSRQTIAWSALSGCALACHFATWISSLSYTSVASSTVLVATVPVFVALGSVLILRERVRPLLYWGLLIALAGTIVITRSDTHNGQNSLLGDSLALAGAIFAAGYFLLGRKLRRSMNTATYVTLCYAMAALVLLPGIFLLQQPLFSYSWQTFGLFALIALVPQMIGHTSFNWALQHLSAPTVSIAVLGEPIGASVLAFFLLQEGINSSALAGGVITLFGVALAIYAEPRQK